MDAGKPVGGRLSFDSENRRPWRGDPAAPTPPRFEPSAITREVDLVVERQRCNGVDQRVQCRAALGAVARRRERKGQGRLVRHGSSEIAIAVLGGRMPLRIGHVGQRGGAVKRRLLARGVAALGAARRVLVVGPGVVGHDEGQQHGADDGQADLQGAHKKRSRLAKNRPLNSDRCHCETTAASTTAGADSLRQCHRGSGFAGPLEASPLGEGAKRRRGIHSSAIDKADSMSTATMRETPCSCMVTPMSCWAISMAILLWLMKRNCVSVLMLITRRA